MRKVISLILTCVITISVFCAPLTAEALTYTPDFEVVSQSAYLVNTDTGKVLYEKEADTSFFNQNDYLYCGIRTL